MVGRDGGGGTVVWQSPWELWGQRSAGLQPWGLCVLERDLPLLLEGAVREGVLHPGLFGVKL